MEFFNTVHILYFICTVLFLAGGAFLVKKVPYAVQNVFFVLLVLGGCGGIFFRYGMGLRWTFDIQWETLLMQLMQVCNFNFLLLPLMLIPKNELARQYSCMFSMFCAFTPFLSPASAWAGLAWYDLQILNSWLNHVCAVALPAFMIAAGRLKPKKQYAFPVLVCVFLYFTAVAGISYLLIRQGLLTVENSFSFVFKQDGIWIFEALYKLIPIPYVYLMPLLPVLYVWFRVWAYIFKKRRVLPFSWRNNQRENAEGERP